MLTLSANVVTSSRMIEEDQDFMVHREEGNGIGYPCLELEKDKGGFLKHLFAFL